MEMKDAHLDDEFVVCERVLRPSTMSACARLIKTMRKRFEMS